MICPDNETCKEFCIRGRIPHEKDDKCDINHEFCPKCIPVKEDNNEGEIICKPIDPNRSY